MIQQVIFKKIFYWRPPHTYLATAILYLATACEFMVAATNRHAAAIYNWCNMT